MSLADLQKRAKEELDEAASKKTSGIPVVYPHENGTFRVKLLYKEESGIIQKKVTRHSVGKDKLPCLSTFGHTCPICEAVKRAEENLGKECGAFKKYGYVTRGVAYAVLVDFDAGMFKEKDDPKKGDLILLMYPKSLYDEFNEIIVKSGEHLESLVAKNYGKTIEVTRGLQSNGIPEYKVNVYPYGDEKIKETDEEWDDLIAKLPNIAEAIVPKHLTEEIEEKVRVAAETVNVEYMHNNTLNPNATEQKQTTQNPMNTNGPIAPSTDIPESVINAGAGAEQPVQFNQPTEETTTKVEEPNIRRDNNSPEGCPECYGNHSDTENKCIVCQFEADCMMATN